MEDNFPISPNNEYNLSTIDKNTKDEIKNNESKKLGKNEIIITLDIKWMDYMSKREVYFLDNTNYIDNKNFQKTHDNLKELNKSNVKLYINEEEYEYNKFFFPKKCGMNIIKLVLDIKIEDCSYMFYNCRNIISIDLSSFDSRNVTNMSNMFSECYNLKNVDLSFLDTKNVKNISYLFNNCINLTNVKIDNFNTNNVVDMSFMFHNCEKLKEIDLSSFNVLNVSDMSYMFSYCKKLKKIIISKSQSKNVSDTNYIVLNSQNIKNINNMFSFCFELDNIDI